MKIAVASGKGGTGKTMVATSLANSLAPTHDVQFIDCDVEAPNAHLFLKPQFEKGIPATIKIPVIDEDLCILCGRCVEVCEFHALAMLQDKILVFPQLCHGCGSCSYNCPVNAICEEAREIGQISTGKSDQITYLMGELTISEPMPTPIIRQLKALADDEIEVTIIDSPPGASCSVVATVSDADFVLLITEPTPFGLHDLKQMMGVLGETHTIGGVIINRDGIGDRCIDDFLINTPYPILMKIPYDKDVAIGLAQGRLLTSIKPDYVSKFQMLFEQIKDQINHNRGGNHV